MKELQVINVRGEPISVTKGPKGEYISLTDMVRNSGGNLIENWLRTKDTIEFLGVWERLNNESFNSLEFEGIKSASGANRFTLSVKQWITRTHAVGILAKTGRHGSGTFAHEDIAIEFASWISPEFKLYLVHEFKRLKAEEADRKGTGWDVKRLIAKANYRLQTDAVREFIIPTRGLSKDREGIAYADEAEMINFVVFGLSSTSWKAENPGIDPRSNIRDHANVIQLTVLSNMESLNATMIADGVNRQERYDKLCRVAQTQFKSLSRTSIEKADRPLLTSENAAVRPANLKTLPAARPPVPIENPSEKLAALRKKLADQK